MEAGIQLSKYLAINLKKTELKKAIIKNQFPILLTSKISKKKELLEKKEVIS